MQDVYKPRIILWGRGFFSQDVYDSLNTNLCEFIGWIDRKVGESRIGVEDYFLPEKLDDASYDFIIVTVKKSYGIKEEIERIDSIDRGRVIYFWEADLRKYYFLIPQVPLYKEEIRLLSFKAENAPYEAGEIIIPKVKGLVETMENLLENGNSLCRFGDAEMRSALKKESQKECLFQAADTRLQDKLYEVLTSSDDGIEIGLADIYGNLDKYIDSEIIFNRTLLCIDDVRKDTMKVLNLERSFANAFVTRPYWRYRDKSHCKTIFDLWKKIWSGRDVLLVEGEYVRFGMGNDLIGGAKTVRRIICPSKDAFAYYDEILKEALDQAESGDLILAALGPTATVLAYDLAKAGYQAIDIGQLDMEYEWYLRGAEDRVSIQGKGVPELINYEVPYDAGTEEYIKQIISIIR
ncbi:MAG: DUF1792 domain-containing protein [Lachnospiraceae bacterium]|nr:DUF1792 domain-containing protein [Lachnospiraceae bacterium]